MTIDDLANTIAEMQEKMTELATDLAALKTAFGNVNKLGSLLDVDIDSSLSIGDVLQYDGSRWTNVYASNLGGSGGGGATTLEQLLDVDISNKQKDQVLAWNTSQQKWINYTLPVGITVTEMWAALNTVDSSKKIDASHIEGFVPTTNGVATNLTVNTALTVSGTMSTTSNATIGGNLSVTGTSTLRNTVNANNNANITGYVAASGEVTAFKS